MSASMYCSIGRYAATECGLSCYFPKEDCILKLDECRRDVKHHLQNVGLRSGFQTKFSSEVESEGQLIALRVGLFGDFSSHKMMTVCPKHRYNLGLNWRSRKVCSYTAHTGTCKPQLSVASDMSYKIFCDTGVLVPIGSGICRPCVKKFNDDHKENDVQKVEEKELSETSDEVLSGPYHFRKRQRIENNDDSLQLSQNTGSLGSSQISNWSEDHLDTEDPLSEINTVIESLGKGSVSPLRFQLQKPLDETANSTKRYLKRKAEEALNLVFEKIAPGQSKNLLHLMMNEREEEECHDELLDTFIKIYTDANDNQIKSYLLSLISSKMSKSELMRKFPNLSKYKVDQARLYAAKYSAGKLSEDDTPDYRQRMDPAKMEHALNFFTNPNFINSVSFGTRQLHLDSGEQICIPDVVRTVCHSALVDMYLQYCHEEEFIPLGKSSLFKMLNACAASKRVSLRGLDNIATDGACAFDNLLSLVDKLCDRGLSVELCDHLKADLVACKRYLKADYKMQIRLEDACADHCRRFSLSDATSPFHQEKCSHSEDHIQCVNCNAVNIATSQIKDCINEVCGTDEQEEFLKECEDAVSKIQDWKSHILRTIHQDTYRTDRLQNLGKNEALVVMDWAMKYLPNFYREKQSDWFAQKGMNWHSSVCIFRGSDNSLKHWTYTHIMQSCKQDWFAVASILEHTLMTMKIQLPHIKEVYLRSDNAGCYHCANLWLSIPGISDRTGVNILEYSYSEASSGKSYCDAKFAHMRGKMRSFVASGNNIISPQNMKEAIDSGKGVTGCQVAVIDIDTSKQSLCNHLWRNVSSINNLKFSSEGVCVFKAYGIGKGLDISNASLMKFSKQITQGDCLPIIISDFVSPGKGEGCIKTTSNEAPCSEAQVEDCREDENQEDEIQNTPIQPSVFHCPEPGCLKVYQKCSSLTEHLLVGEHKFKKTTVSSFDKVKQRWAESCNSVEETNQTRSRRNRNQDENSEEISPLIMGWALKKDRKNQRFSDSVKKYLKVVFEDGEKSGRKSNPVDVAKTLKTVRGSDGKKKFQPSEWLQPSQIASYFCRLSVLRRSHTEKLESICNVDDEDLLAVLSSLEDADVRERMNATNSC